MKRWIKKIIPSKRSIDKSSELKKLKPFFKSSTLWSLDCQPVARGVAAGLAGCVIPGFQLFYAAVLVILLRGNLPIALAATLVTNPFTVIPMIYFIYFVGSLIIGNDQPKAEIQPFNWNFSSFQAFWDSFSVWILQFGKSFFVGLPIVSFCFGIIGYFGTILIWKLFKSR